MSNIVKGSGIIYTTGVPNTLPNQGTDAEFAIDINGNQYAWNRTNKVWDNMGQAIEIATSSAVPTHVPSNFRPRFLMTPSRELYFYSGSWGTVGSLPSGLISSSAQIGPTGIYSGSGMIPAGTEAILETNGEFVLEYSNVNPAIYINDTDEGDAGVTIAARDSFNQLSIYKNNIFIGDTSPEGITMEINRVDEIMRINDNRSTPTGIQYGGNYTSSFTTSSLIDRRYADKHIAFSSSAAATSASLISGRGGIYNGSGAVPDGTSANINGTCYFNFNSIFSTFGIGDMDGNYYGMRTTATADTITIGNTAGLGDQYFIVTQKGGDEQIELNSQYKINIHTNTLAFLFNNSTQTAIFSDNSDVPLGIQYEQDYSSIIIDNDRSLPDIGTVKSMYGVVGATGGTGTTDSNGIIRITHNFGYIPTVAIATAYITSFPVIITVYDLATTYVDFKFWRTDNSAHANSSIDFGYHIK